MFPEQLAIEAAALASLSPAARRTVTDALALLIDAMQPLSTG